MSPLPTFIGIGVPKAATTWLHELLGSHPDVLMAQGRKEVHFFDQHFDRGPSWYEGFFPARQPPPLAVGEITPHYLYDERCIDRMAATLPDVTLLLSLRNPVDRLLSHHRFRQRVDGYQGTVAQFVIDYPDALSWGRYATHLRPWLDRFSPERWCFVVVEDDTRDVVRLKRRLAAFVGVDPDHFPADAGRRPVNESSLPRRRRLYAAATRQARWLRRRDADWAVRLVKRAGADRWTSGGRVAAPAASDADRDRLWAEYEPEVEALAALTGLALDAWRPGGTTSGDL